MAPRRDPEDSTALAVREMGVVAPSPIHIETAVFEGSLAMLFRCVRDHKVDLLQVPLMPICEAYFQYLLDLRKDEVDEASSALAALAYLIERKAFMLLPQIEEEEEMPFEEPGELPEPTVHEFSSAIEALRLWHDERTNLFFRPLEGGTPTYELPYQLANVSAGDLARALERLLRRAQPEVRPLGKPRRSVAEQMTLVLEALSDAPQPLDALLTEPFTFLDAVYWFLALLELIRLGQAVASIEGEDVLFARS